MTGSSFLTAAEQREQGKKNEKKAAEDPYAFLAEVQDKERRKPGDPNYDPRTLYIPAKAWKDFTPFEKQVSTSHRGSFNVPDSSNSLVLGGLLVYISRFTFAQTIR